MNSKKRNLLSLLLLAFLCSALAFLASDRGHKSNPDQLVVETRYSLPWTDRIGIVRGQERLFLLPETFQWTSGAPREKVIEALGNPSFEFEFLGDDFYVWEVDARYDWDLKDEFSGRYLALRFYGRLYSATISQDLPADAQAFSGFGDEAAKLDCE